MPELPAANLQRAEDVPKDWHISSIVITVLFMGISFANWQCYSPSSKNYGYCYQTKSKLDENELYLFLILGQIIFFLMYWIDCCASSSRQCLRNDMEIPEYQSFMRQVKGSQPRIGIKIECYHYEKTSDGGQKKKVKYSGTSYWHYKNFRDETGEILGLNEGKMIKLQLSKSFKFGNDTSITEFDAFRQNYIQNNKKRDEQIEGSFVFDYGGIEETDVLVQSKGASRSCCMSSFWFWFWSLLFLSWPYRIWLESKTVAKQIEVKKVIYGWKDEESIL